MRLFVDAALDYERRSAYVVTLQAADASESPLRAAASVAVAVRDEQDQPPVFLNAPYSATVPENTPTVIVLLSTPQARQLLTSLTILRLCRGAIRANDVPTILRASTNEQNLTRQMY